MWIILDTQVLDDISVIVYFKTVFKSFSVNCVSCISINLGNNDSLIPH